MNNGQDNEGGMDPTTSCGNSRVRVREPLRLDAADPNGQVQVVERPNGEAVLTVYAGPRGGCGIALTGAQQRELADWLAEGAEPDPRWTDPKPPEGSLQLVHPSGYSELRLIQHVYHPEHTKADWAMLAVRAGNRIVEFALSAQRLAQLYGWLDGVLPGLANGASPSEACNTETAEHPMPRSRDRVLQEAEDTALDRPSCKSCPFWEGGVQGDPGHGLCRAQPPSAAIADCRAIWPETQQFDFCGQHPHFAVQISGTLSHVEDWEREGRVPPGYADSPERTPEDVAKAGSLTWAVAQTGAVRDGCGLWNVAGHVKLLGDAEVIALANRRAACPHDRIVASADRKRAFCADCGERSE